MRARSLLAPLVLLAACAPPSPAPEPAPAPAATAPRASPRTPRPIVERADVAARGFGNVIGRVPGTTDPVSGPRLAAHRVRTVIRGAWARTEIEEDVANDSDRVLEGRFSFALPPGASVSRVALWVGDKLVEGELEEKKRAEAIFRGIVEDTVRPRDPALLEHAGGGRFSLTIFPLPAHGTRRVVLAYDEALVATTDGVRYTLPLSLGGARANAIDDLSVDVAVADAGADVAASGHDVERVIEGDVQHLRFHDRAATPTAPLEIGVKRVAEPVSAYVAHPGEFSAPGARALADEPDGFLAVRLPVPPLDDAAPPAPRTLSIALDTSHGQTPESLRASAAIAVRVIERLGPGDRFALLACDSACEAFPVEGSASADDDAAVDAARRFSDALTPAGAHDLAGALVTAARRAGERGQVLYLGEGAATAGELDADSIREHVRALAPAGVSFQLEGAGPAVDGLTLDALASGLGGVFTRTPGDSLEARADAIARDVSRPLVRDVAIDLPAGVAVAGRMPTALRSGDTRVVLAGFGATTVSGVAVLRGTIDGRPVRATVPIRIDRASLPQNPLVPRAWAEARLASLEASPDAAAARDAVSISRRFHVLSRHTAMLVLENEKMFADLGVARTARVASQRSDQAFTDDVATPGLGAVGAQGFGAGMGRLGGDHKTSPPRVRMGATSVSGRLPPEVIQRIVRQDFGRFRLCYERGLRANPALAGRVTTSFVIDRQGSVSTVADGGSDLPDREVVGCVVRSFSGLSFPQPEGGIVTVRYPILFSPGDGSPAPSYRRSSSTEERALAADDAWTLAGEASLARMRAARDEQPTSRKLHTALIRALLANGRFDEARTSALDLASRDPDDALAHQLLAWASAANGAGTDAARALDVVASLAPRDARAHAIAARSWSAAGDERRACAHFRARAALRPTDDDARVAALRCLARTTDLAYATTLAQTLPDRPAVRALRAELAASSPAPWNEQSLPIGVFEAKRTCTSTCAPIAVVMPSGRVISAFTPAETTRATFDHVAVGVGSGVVRVVSLGDVAPGELKLRVDDKTRTVLVRDGASRTLAASEITVYGGFGFR
jgi:Ca-activated chloride channel family protein